MGWVAGIIAAIALAAGLWWYLKRAKRVSAATDECHSFQKNLLLDLQDIRDKADGELVPALDELIDIARYSTPGSNDETAELDAQISAEVHKLAEAPTVAAAESLRTKLVSRNRRAKH